MPAPDPRAAARPLVSVVVPVYDVEEYLDACLVSITEQDWPSLEVVVVDDGSTDASLEVAHAFAARDPRVRVHGFENAGLGAARNRGAALATGEYLLFADSDDVVLPGALTALAGSLEATGSDVASGNVRRMRGATLLPSPPHEAALARRRLRTRLADDPVLVQDTTAWNKVFRTSFWREHDLRWGEGVLYEDMATVARAFGVARAVDVVGVPTYVWRYRDSGVSITQRRSETRNLRDRLLALDGSEPPFRAAGSAVLDAFVEKVLTLDLALYVAAAPDADDEFRSLLGAAVERWLGAASDAVRRRVPVRRRAQLELARAGRFAEAAAVDAWFAEHAGDLPTTVGADGVRAVQVPAALTPGGALPAAAVAADGTRHETAVGRVDLDGEDLVLTGWTTGPGDAPATLTLTAPSRWQARAASRAWLAPLARLAGTTRVDLPTVAAEVPEAPDTAAGRGFAARVPVRRLLDVPGDLGWRVTTGDEGERPVVARASAPRTPARALDGGVLLQVAGGGGEPVELRVTHPAVRATAVRWEGDVAVVEVAATGPVRSASLQPSDEAALVEVENRSDGATLRIAVPAEGGRRTVRASTAAGSVAVVWSVPHAPASFSEAGVAARADRRGRLVVEPASTGLEVDSLAVAPGPVLEVAGTVRGTVTDASLGLEPAEGGARDDVRHAVRRDGARFTATVPLTAPSSDGVRRPLPADARPALVWSGTDTGGAARLTPDASALLPQRVPTPEGLVELSPASGDRVAVKVRPALAPDETGRGRRRRVAAEAAALTRQTPLTDEVVVLQTGDGALESPRAVVDELARRGSADRVLWAVGDASVATPEGAPTLLVGSRAFHETLGRARLVVCDGPLPAAFERRPGQTVLQTGHARPLGRIGHDLGSIRPTDLAQLVHDAGQWSLLLSPGSWATPALRRGLGYPGEVAGVGTPGADALVRADAAAVRAELAAVLGLADDVRVVLWSPVPQGIARVDTGALARDLGAGYAVLTSEGRRVRRAGADGRDVAVPVAVLTAVVGADTHVTNHLSGALDLVLTRGDVHLIGRAAGTGTPDDLRAVTPAPAVDRAELVTALRAHAAPDWSAFRVRCCALQDGHAAERAVDALERHAGRATEG
ncbi:glycosyltransferase [Cellulomonas alba]|uniref:Glycosyltransferase n=1 Tax=Cellulomonas alba TaxID=3053467 RepID=A0ABT7SCX2_9CELL|nr:glycosyltransferase [Cellulomonas alba]MDM7854025.1 glycosyltransferase [Cellulomonas alba]